MKRPQMTIGVDDILPLAIGASFLGAGGGGGRNQNVEALATEVLTRTGPVPVDSPLDCSDDKFSVCAALMGTPTALNEKFVDPAAFISAVDLTESALSRHVDYILPLEIGGINALVPVIAAAMSERPLLDADGMARAFPLLTMTTFHANGLSLCPVVMESERDRVVLTGMSNAEAEVRAVEEVHRLGGCATLSGYAMSLSQLKEVGCLHTLSLAKRLGEILLGQATKLEQVIEELQSTLTRSSYGRLSVLVEGKVVKIERFVRDRQLEGRVSVSGYGVCGSGQVDIAFRNEFLMAEVGGVPVTMVPDILCLLDGTSGIPLSIEDIEDHQYVCVVSVPSPLMLRTQCMREAVGPRQFGIERDFAAVERLVGAETGVFHV